MQIVDLAPLVFTVMDVIKGGKVLFLMIGIEFIGEYFYKLAVRAASVEICLGVKNQILGLTVPTQIQELLVLGNHFQAISGRRLKQHYGKDAYDNSKHADDAIKLKEHLVETVDHTQKAVEALSPLVEVTDSSQLLAELPRLHMTARELGHAYTELVQMSELIKPILLDLHAQAGHNIMHILPETLQYGWVFGVV
jgi:hypothetical protein